LSLIDAATDPNGLQLKHGIDIVVGAASFIPVVGQFIAVGWFVGNLVSLGYNGKSISENIQQGADSYNKNWLKGMDISNPISGGDH
jgi:hypothetical protein